MKTSMNSFHKLKTVFDFSKYLLNINSTSEAYYALNAFARIF